MGVPEPVPGELHVPTAAGGDVHPVWRLGHHHDHEDVDRGAAGVPHTREIHCATVGTDPCQAARRVGQTVCMVRLDALQSSHHTNSVC